MLHWSFVLLLVYVVLSHRGVITVFAGNGSLPAAAAGDVGIFRIFSSGSSFIEFLQPLQAEFHDLIPGAVVMYKTHEAEAEFKLATVMDAHTAGPKEHFFVNGDRRPILHRDVFLRDLVPSVNETLDIAKAREIGVWLRRWSDECACGDDYPGQPRDFFKPVSDIHGVLYTLVPFMGFLRLPILLLQQIKVFVAGSGIGSGLVSFIYSTSAGYHVTFYDLYLNLDPRGSCMLLALCCLVSYPAFSYAAVLVGTQSATIIGTFCIVFVDLHEVLLDIVEWLWEAAEDLAAERVGGPAYFGWPVHGDPGRFYADDLSFAHAQGEGLSTLALLSGRLLRLSPDLLLLLRRLRGDRPSARLSEGEGEGRGDGEESKKKGSKLQKERAELVAKQLRCRLSGLVMEDPVAAADGFSFERKAIEEYLQGSSASPVTGAPLPFTHLVENIALRSVIESWRQRPSLGPDSGVEEEVKCPITMGRLRDAVLTCDGHSYEREAIIKWLRRHESSPKSNVRLPSKALVTNHNLSEIAAALALAE